jgi:glycosyltransferase involved in cell wall biosynthesis
MLIAEDTAAVMTTHDGERFIEAQCASIFAQTLLPALLVVVDDASADSTSALLRSIRGTSPIRMEIISVDRSRSRDLRGRIAQNVLDGLAAAGTYRFAILSDQDDAWLEDRLASQRRLLLETPDALVVAGDGIVVDDTGKALGSTLRQSFPVPADWGSQTPRERMRTALGQPLATGAAIAMTDDAARLIRPVPDGWLLDRWATLVATARCGLVVQREPVIRYRAHAGQVLGLRQAAVGTGDRRWRQVIERGATPTEAARKVSDVVRRLRPLATDPDVRAELSWAAVLGSAAART